MTLTNLQSDLLLDVFEQGQTIRSLFEQKEEAQQTGDDDDVRDVTKLYDKACERLGFLCEEADTHGVPEETIREACRKALPEHLDLASVPLSS